MRCSTCLTLAAVVLALPGPARADDETSSGDKLRILYAGRFSFGDDGAPLVTVEIMSGQDQVVIDGDGDGAILMPDGDGGAAIHGGKRWTITASGTRPGEVKAWTVVAHHGPDDHDAIADDLEHWKQLGYQVKSFESGTVFAVDGAVMDTRQVQIAIDPVAPAEGEGHARSLAAKYTIATSVYHELTRRPRGTVIAQSGETRVDNPSVLWFAPGKGGDTLRVRDVPTGGGGSQLETGKEDRRYLGRVYVTIGKDGKLTVVNAISAEKLLAGLVPSEMYPSAPADALRAQAVAARTELIEKLGTRHEDEPFLVCSTQHCQVYGGAGHEDARTTRAVDATRGQVLARKQGGLVDARYSADCGGHGENAENIWGGEADPQLRGRRDAAKDDRYAELDESKLASFVAADDAGAYCGGEHKAGRHRWTVRLGADELDRKIATESPTVGHVRRLTARSRGVSGRILTLAVEGDRGTVEITGDLHIRRLLGGLKSTLFSVDVEGKATAPTAFVLHGAGFGHGVGMCQVGAIGMARLKQDFRAILEHYYRGSALQRLY